MQKIVVAIAVGLGLTTLNLIFDFLKRNNKENVGTYTILVPCVISAVWLASRNYHGLVELAGGTVLFLIVCGVVWGMSLGLFEAGQGRGKKYWRTHVENFYAYGTGLLIVLGMSLFLVLGNLARSGSPEDEYYEPKPDLDFAILLAIGLTAASLPIFWAGIAVGQAKASQTARVADASESILNKAGKPLTLEDMLIKITERGISVSRPLLYSILNNDIRFILSDEKPTTVKLWDRLSKRLEL